MMNHSELEWIRRAKNGSVSEVVISIGITENRAHDCYQRVFMTAEWLAFVFAPIA